MIDKAELTKVIEQALADTECYLVQLSVSRDNIINVDIDSDGDVSVDDCLALNDAVLAAFDRDVEDYELTVGSYGITSPLLLPRQYRKYEGEEAEVLTADGRKLKGTLGDSDDEGFTLLTEQKQKEEGKKRPKLVTVPVRLRYDEAKQTRIVISV